ncbi:MAG: ATP-binding protein [bacterium]|nr:ATP-binding protein [bacterium]
MHCNSNKAIEISLPIEGVASKIPMCFNDMFASSPDAISINAVREDGLPGSFLYVNEVACQRSGYSREEMLSMSPVDLMDKDIRMDVPRLACEFMRKGRIVFEAVYVAKDGRKLPSEISIHRFKVGDGELALSVVRDISKRRQAEEQMLQAVKMETVCRLAGGIAHEFNNILMGISGYSQLALRRLESDNPLTRDLGLISELADRAAELTRQLLTFARRQPINPSEANINEVISDTSSMLGHIAVSQDAELVLKLKAGPEKLKVDQQQIKQVLLNMVINACDAMPNGGTVTLETSEVLIEDGSHAPVPCLKPGRYVLISVKDTGCGMDEETQQHIFEPFFTTRACGEGTGLGLATAHSIIEQHKGFIGVSSRPGNGTTLSIYLPRPA